MVKAEREAKTGITFTTSATHTMIHLGLKHADGSPKLTKVRLNTRKKESTCAPMYGGKVSTAVNADAATVGHVTALKAQVAAMETELAKLEASPPAVCVKVLQARDVVLTGKAAEKAEEKKRKKAEKDRRVANKLVTELEKSM